ncbi:uncharacterized protein LOC127797154 isoform X2 [Diospyros lotus]|uniref:uncharacterized protein LOC127797154 isoform X2 n=1 Tax=Diospyros lotus TaxID=55363 RepID=UPI00224ED993|nr:uncharacterized protein LOC127797154 isoform X2 [Diospyros lotus]
MSPVLLASRPPLQPSYDARALHKPNPEGQIATIFSCICFELFREYLSRNMNSSNANAWPSGKPVIGSASGRTKSRLVKMRRRGGSPCSTSNLAPEAGKTDVRLNSFPSSSDNLGPYQFGEETGCSVVGNFGSGNDGKETFVFGASRGKSSSNMSSNNANSDGFIEAKVIHDMRKLKIQNQPHTVNQILKLNESDTVTASRAEGNMGFATLDRLNKRSGVDDNAVSELPYEMQKLNIACSGPVDNISNVKDLNSNLNENNKIEFRFGRCLEVELTEEMKKLNVKDAVGYDGSGYNYDVDDAKQFMFGNINKGRGPLAGNSVNMLPDKMKDLNIKDSVNAYSGEEGNFSFGDKSSFSFGGGRGASGGINGRAENLISEEMRKLKIEREAGDNIVQRQTSGHSRVLFPGEMLGNLGDKKFQDVKSPITTEFTFQAVLNGQDKKLEFHANRESAKDARSKKKRGKRKPTPGQQRFRQDYVHRESSPGVQPDSESYSPMDVSPYLEVVADNEGSKETSVTSEEALHCDHSIASSESHPSFSNEDLDEDLVFATQRLNFNEGDDKFTEPNMEPSECEFDSAFGGEDPSKGSISRSESFKSAAGLSDYSCDTFVSAADTEVSSSLRIESDDTDGRTGFCFASHTEDAGGTNFMFTASSSAQGQSSAGMFFHKKKIRAKVVREKYSPQKRVAHASSTTQFFPLSERVSLLPPRQGQKGDPPTLLSKREDTSEVVMEPESMPQGTPCIPSASIAAQEACEKWRLRGNQAYANRDMSKAEEYYTQGVNCVAQNESSPRSCLRALMLCYSNRAATRMCQGRLREALADCMKAAAIDPSFYRVQLRAANCYLALGEVEDASLHFMKCLQSGSNACVDQKLVLEASEGLEKSQKVFECMKQSTGLLQRGISCDAESALGVIIEALTISSYSEKLLQMKGDALLMLRRYEELIQLCEQTLGSAEMNCSVISGDKNLTDLDHIDVEKNLSFRLWRWHLTIKSYFYLGKLDEALDFVKKQEESISTTKKSGSKTLESLIPLAGTIRILVHHKASGNEAFQSGRHAEAVEHYTAALSCTVESRPFAAVCFCNRSAAYKAMGQIIDAISDCSLAIALDGNYLKAISRRASLFEIIRDYEQAILDLKRLIAVLTKQVEDKAKQSGASDRTISVNELRQSQHLLSLMEEEARKEIPLNMYLIFGRSMI